VKSRPPQRQCTAPALRRIATSHPARTAGHPGHRQTQAGDRAVNGVSGRAEQASSRGGSKIDQGRQERLAQRPVLVAGRSHRHRLAQCPVPKVSLRWPGPAGAHPTETLRAAPHCRGDPARTHWLRSRSPAYLQYAGSLRPCQTSSGPPATVNGPRTRDTNGHSRPLSGRFARLRGGRLCRGPSRLPQAQDRADEEAGGRDQGEPQTYALVAVAEVLEGNGDH
jgi:hypothetical protein